jgi:hypothetical protein
MPAKLSLLVVSGWTFCLFVSVILVLPISHELICLVRHVPAWLPGASFQQLALDHHLTQRRALDNPINVVKAQMVRCVSSPNHDDHQ